MDQKQIFKQMMDFNKQAFDNSFSVMSELQEQTEKLMLNFLENEVWISVDGKL